MAILGDRDITEMILKGFLISENFSEKSVTPNGYDFRAHQVRIDGSDFDKVDLNPGKFALVSSLEYFNMPKNVIGNIWLRSSFARKGLIGTFGVIDAGYQGNITVGLYNAGSSSVTLKTEERIAQIVFSMLITEAEHDYGIRSGNYQGKRGLVEAHDTKK